MVGKKIFRKLYEQGDEKFSDPYIDLVLSQLLEPAIAVKLSLEERVVLMAAVRSEILTSKIIKDHLKKKAESVFDELLSARQSFPTIEN